MRPLICVCLLSVAIAADAASVRTSLRGALPGLAIGTAQSQSQPLSALRDAERRRAEAVATRDIDTLRRVIDTDYYHVETNGRVRTRSEFLQLLERDEYEFRAYTNVSAEIQLLDGGQTAVVRGRLQADMLPANRQREFRGRYVRIWHLGPEGWRNSMMQSTEITPAR